MVSHNLEPGLDVRFDEVDDGREQTFKVQSGPMLHAGVLNLGLG